MLGEEDSRQAQEGMSTEVGGGGNGATEDWKESSVTGSWQAEVPNGDRDVQGSVHSDQLSHRKCML